jgi:predicted small metal-binding protein
MKKLSCRDAGFNCDYIMEGKNDDEVMAKARDHGAKQHGLSKLTPEQEQQLRGRIKNV